MKARSALQALALAVLPAAAWAGPPFDTDDPDPTDPGHWEIYLANTIDGLGTSHEGEAAFEANYGAAPNLQLSAELPYNYVRDRDDGRAHGIGDLGLSVKYRLFNDEASGVSIAAFPAVSIPTGANSVSEHHVVTTLPLWAQVRRGKWAVFGGGGYVIHPGSGNRDYWTAGIAALAQASDRLAIGGEVTREGPVELGERATTGLGIGIIYRIKAPFSLLMRGGPTFVDGGGAARYHLYAALGLNF
jgi:hypothetical protein